MGSILFDDFAMRVEKSNRFSGAADDLRVYPQAFFFQLVLNGNARQPGNDGNQSKVNLGGHTGMQRIKRKRSDHRAARIKHWSGPAGQEAQFLGQRTESVRPSVVRLNIWADDLGLLVGSQSAGTYVGINRNAIQSAVIFCRQTRSGCGPNSQFGVDECDRTSDVFALRFAVAGYRGKGLDEWPARGYQLEDTGLKAKQRFVGRRHVRTGRAAQLGG